MLRNDLQDMNRKTQRLIGDVGSTQKYAKVFTTDNFLFSFIFNTLSEKCAIQVLRFFNCFT